MQHIFIHDMNKNEFFDTTLPRNLQLVIYQICVSQNVIFYNLKTTNTIEIYQRI